jgi:hypothetical protein
MFNSLKMGDDPGTNKKRWSDPISIRRGGISPSPLACLPLANIQETGERKPRAEIPPGVD